MLGALTGVLGAMMALEVVRETVHFGEGLAGRLMLVDALGMPTTFFSGLFAGAGGGTADSDSVNAGSNPGPPAIHLSKICMYFQFPG